MPPRRRTPKTSPTSRRRNGDTDTDTDTSGSGNHDAEQSAQQGEDREVPLVAGGLLEEVDRLVQEEYAPKAAPRAVRGEWFPCSVRLPATKTVAHTVKVYATAEGLWVYDRKPGDPDGLLVGPGEALFFSPIDYSKTSRPDPRYAARQAGFVVYTDAGPVQVNRTGGCGCSHRTLKHWRPSWASRTEPWTG